MSVANIIGQLKRPASSTPAAPPDPDAVPVGIDGVIAATEKLLAVNRGLAHPDERDSQQFKHLMTVDKLMQERVNLDADKPRLGTMRRVARTRTLKPVNPGAFNSYTEGMLVGHPLSMPLEEINPMHLLEQARRVTHMGPGGLGSDSSISEDAQALHPSSFGFISAIEGPECHSYDTEVFTKLGWKFWPDVTVTDELACMRTDRTIFFSRPERLIAQEYSGNMIRADARMFHFMVTPNHRLFCTRHPGGDKPFMFLAGDFDKRWAVRFDTGAKPYTGDAAFLHFQVPALTVTNNNQNELPPIAIGDWCEFMGWYLSEGCCSDYVVKGRTYRNYHARISQSDKVNPDCVQAIKFLLSRMPFASSYSDRAFHIPGKQLTTYLKQFGFALDKFIPEELFDAPVFARERLLHALLMGDGRMTPKHTTFTSFSLKLALGFERLAVSLGHTVNFKKYFDKRPNVQAWSYEVSLLKLRERIVSAKPSQGIGGLFSREKYKGKVYCATVPGGMLLTRRGASTGIWTGNSERAGVDVRLAHGTKLGDDGRIYQKFWDPKAKAHRWMSPVDLDGKVVGLPE